MRHALARRAALRRGHLCKRAQCDRVRPVPGRGLLPVDRRRARAMRVRLLFGGRRGRVHARARRRRLARPRHSRCVRRRAVCARRRVELRQLPGRCGVRFRGGGARALRARLVRARQFDRVHAVSARLCVRVDWRRAVAVRGGRLCRARQRGVHDVSIGWVFSPFSFRSITRRLLIENVFLFDVSLGAGFACPNSTSVPLPCSPGQYALAGALACTSCPAGMDIISSRRASVHQTIHHLH